MLSFVSASFGQLLETKPQATNTYSGIPILRKPLVQQPLPNTGRLTHDFTAEPDSYVVVEPSDAGEHLFVKFEEPKSRRLVASMFIRAGAVFSVSNQMVLPSGHYVVKLASGTNWFGVADAFGSNGVYNVLRPDVSIQPNTQHRLRLQSSRRSSLRQNDLKWSQF